MKKRLIVNADDFGLCHAVNRAVVIAHTDGVLTSATIMVNMSGAEEAVEIAKQLPSLGVGVHLNLTDGCPLSKCSGLSGQLTGGGEFTYSPEKLALYSLIRPQVRKAIKSELAAQIQWVIDKGLKPTHLDSHKHVHIFPPIFFMVCELARRFGIDAIRWTFETASLCRPPWPLPSEGGKKRAKTVRAMARINRLQNRSMLKTDAFFGVAHTGKIDVSFYKAVALYSSSATAEVMTHPGFAEGLNPAGTRLVREREVELQALCSKETKRYLRDAGIELVHYGQL